MRRFHGVLCLLLILMFVTPVQPTPAPIDPTPDVVFDNTPDPGIFLNVNAPEAAVSP